MLSGKGDSKGVPFTEESCDRIVNVKHRFRCFWQKLRAIPELGQHVQAQKLVPLNQAELP
jgi:hypothetical protein